MEQTKYDRIRKINNYLMTGSFSWPGAALAAALTLYLPVSDTTLYITDDFYKDSGGIVWW